MKKQFFYAALAIGMMSSCSSNNLPGNQQPENPEDERVAIELGVSPLNTVVSTRGTGYVGNKANGATAEWAGQALGIFMAEKGTLTKAVDIDGTYFFEGLTFTAPVSGNSGTVKNNKGAVKYYPLTGAFDFYGWHLDDATGADAITADNLTGQITIDGTQDLMVGKAEVTSDQETKFNDDITGSFTMENAKARAYSSWAARRGVQPIIKFKHLLARLDFKACLGKDLNETPLDKITVTNTRGGQSYEVAYTAENGYPQPKTNQIANGVYVKSIEVIDPVTTFDVTVAAIDENNLGISNQQAASEDGLTTFKLMQKSTTPGSVMEKLIPVNAGITKNDDGIDVGDGIMIVPGSNKFKMKVVLMQYVKVIDKDDATNPADINDIYEWKENEMTTEVALPEGTFGEGKYYTVKITMFGFQKIQVTAELAAWQSGGEPITSNPEDDNFTTGQ